MIQRIQSLYLLVAAALLAVAIFTPIASFTGGGTQLTLSAFELSDSEGVYAESALWMGILLSLSALLPLVTIFLYKHRQLQIRLCGVELVLLVGDIAFMTIYYLLAERVVEATAFPASAIRFGAIMPVVAIVFVALAMRAIFRDELLVRSLDRIR